MLSLVQQQTLEDKRELKKEELMRKDQLSIILEARVEARWEASKLAYFEYGESAGKLLAWKTRMDQVRNVVQEIKNEVMGLTASIFMTSKRPSLIFSQIYIQRSLK